MKKPMDMYESAKAIIDRPYCPYSDFPVAVAVRAQSGKIYAGVNVENVSYGLTCCAEKNAISTMITLGDTIITEVLVLVPGPRICAPCGACRQIILEFASPDCQAHLCTLNENNYQHYLFKDLLPGAFDNCESPTGVGA